MKGGKQDSPLDEKLKMKWYEGSRSLERSLKSRFSSLLEATVTEIQNQLNIHDSNSRKVTEKPTRFLRELSSQGKVVVDVVDDDELGESCLFSFFLF